MTSLEDFAAARLRALERRRLKRELAVTDPLAGADVRRDGRTLVSFAANDYLGLSRDPEVIAAGVAATERYGTGAGAARLITGNHPLYADLEAKLAALKGAEDAVVFGSGYLANLGIIPALAGPSDLVLLDELAHSCLLNGAALSRSRTLAFRHNDAAHAAALLQEHRGSHRHCLIVTEGVFSMDGDLAPLPGLARLAAEHDAWLMTDDAHALGVIGAGRGSSFAHEPPVDVPLQMGTLSKAAGAYGGYLCASRAVCALVRNRAASFVYSTGLPPGTVAAAAKALDIIANDRERVARPLERARLFTVALGLPAPASAIVPIVLGGVERAQAASAALLEAGFLVPAIRPPTVPAGTARLRLAFAATHDVADVQRLAAAVAPLLHDRSE